MYATLHIAPINNGPYDDNVKLGKSVKTEIDVKSEHAVFNMKSE